MIREVPQSYRQLHVDVPVWRHDSVQDEVIDRQGLPIDESVFSETIPFRVRESTNEDDSGRFDPEIISSLPFYRPSTSHGRSHELGIPSTPLAVWADANGNKFSSLSIKGANGTEPRITTSPTAPSGFLPYGFQEDDALVRVLRSSRMLREAGVPAEWVVDVLEPKLYPLEGNLVGEKVFKQYLVESALKDKKLTEKLPTLAVALGKMSFFVTVRAMDIGERVWDLETSKIGDVESHSKEKNQGLLRKTLRLYNLTHENTPDFIPLDAKNPEDVTTYLTDILPAQIGKNYAKLHNLGLAHKYAHFGNITMLGGIVDLDSVHGEPLNLGDSPVSGADIATDTRRVMTEISGQFQETLKTLVRDGTASPETDYHNAETAFALAYIGASESGADGVWSIMVSPSVSGVEITTRNEVLIGYLRDWIGRSLKLDGSALSNMIDKYLVANSEHVQKLSSIIFSDTADQIMNEALTEGHSHETMMEGISTVLDLAWDDMGEQNRKHVYKTTVTDCGLALRRVFDKKFKDEAGYGDMGHYANAFIASFINMQSPYLQVEHYQGAELDTAITEYTENLANQYALEDVQELLPWKNDVAGYFSGKRYYVTPEVVESEFMQAVSKLPDDYVVHEIQRELSREDEWTWLKPMWFFSDSESFVFTRHEKEGHSMLVPRVDHGSKYVAMCTEKDQDGKYHVIISRSKTGTF